ncbi:transporter [Bacteroidia bacterium]|nr:transporter [Bacteroidia bacterium]
MTTLNYIKKTFAYCAMLLVAHSVTAQEKWSLERCIEHAVANNLQIKMQEINREAKEIDLHTARHSWLPNLNANAGQSFDFGRGTDRTGAMVDQTVTSTSLSVSSSMPLFTGFQITNDIKNKRYSVMVAEESLKKAKENIAIAVAQSFLDVLLRKEIHKINTETLNFTLDNVKKTEVMVNNGSVPSAQLYEIKSQQAADEVRVTTADNDVILGLLTLGQLLELTKVDSFDIAMPQIGDSVELTSSNIPSPDNIFGMALSAKPQIREAELQLEGSKAMLKIAQSGYYPQLNLSAGIKDGYYRSDNANVLSFSNQISDNLQEYVGLSLQIPIFNRFAIKNNVKQARIGIAQQQLMLEDAKKTLYKEIQQAYHNAVATQKSYRASQKSVEAAREAFRYAHTKYQTGKSSVYEFTEAKTTLTRSLSEEAQAKFNYVFAVKILDFYSGTPIHN